MVFITYVFFNSKSYIDIKGYFILFTWTRYREINTNEFNVLTAGYGNLKIGYGQKKLTVRKHET